MCLPTARNNSFHFGSELGAQMAATYHSIISTVKLHGSSVWSDIDKFFKKSLRVAGVILHSYPLVSDWNSPQCEFTIDFFYKVNKGRH